MNKTLAIAEFEALLAAPGWTHVQTHEVVDRLNRHVEEQGEDDDEPRLRDVPHAWGWVAITSTLDGITITYNETFSFDECEPDSLGSSAEGLENKLEVAGVTVLDEDGDEMPVHKLADYIDADAFTTIDLAALAAELGIAQITDIDLDEDSGMDTHVLTVDNAPDLRFSGEVLGKASSSDDRAMGSSYSGQTGRWTELTLYRTAGGKFIAHQVGRTRWQGERDRFSAAVCESLDEVKAFFGHRWLAKELYEAAGIDTAIDVA